MLLVASCGYEDQHLVVESLDTGEVVFEKHVDSINVNGTALSHDNRLVAIAGA